MKTTVIHHSADYDGIFCGEIARKFLPDAEFIGWDYRDPKIPFPSEGMVYVLDLSPDCFLTNPVFNEDKYDDQLGRLIWIDHHKTAIDAWPKNIAGHRIDGVAACRLAWQWFDNVLGLKIDTSDRSSKEMYVSRSVSEPLAVRLAGEYDIWDKRDERAEVFQFGLRSRELTAHDWSEMLTSRKATIEEIESLVAVGHDKDILNPDGTHNPAVVWQLLDAGKMLQKYQQRNDAGAMKRSFMVEWEGLKFIAITQTSFNSLTFAAKDIPETGHDALLGCYFDGKLWNVSLYHAKHNTSIDLSEIAKKHGGGGHRGACGFRTEKLPFIP